MKLIRPHNDSIAPDPEAVAARVRARLGERNVVMVGLMGCGKTSVGRRVAQMLGLAFIDADEEIERVANKTIAEIFEDHGEDYFRAGERRVIARLMKEPGQVLATGGGAYLNAETRQTIRERGISVWLKADLPLLMRRVRRRTNRPLLRTADPEAVMQALMEKRYPVYREADVTVESRDVSHDLMAMDVISSIDHFL